MSVTPGDVLKKLTPFEQQNLLNGYLDQVKDLIEDAVGSADVENFDEAESAIEDLEICFAQASSLKDIIINGIREDK